MHKSESRFPSNPNEVVPVILAAKGLRVTTGGVIDSRYVDGASLAMRKIQDWYKGQLDNKTFRLGAPVTYVSKRTVAELLVGMLNPMTVESTLQLIKEAHEEGVLDFCNPNKLFAVMTAGMWGTTGQAFGRLYYGTASCTNPELENAAGAAAGLACGWAGPISAQIAGLDPIAEGLGPAQGSLDGHTGAMGHEMGHAWGLPHPDSPLAGYYNVGLQYNSGAGISYSPNTVTDLSKNWAKNQWVGPAPYNDLEVEVGGQYKRIVSNTANTITIDGTFSPTPGAGQLYYVGLVRSIMGTAFNSFPNIVYCILYRGEKDWLLAKFPDWFV